MNTRITGDRARSLLVATVVVALAGALAGCGSSSSAGTTPSARPSPAATAGATANASIQNLAFTPKTLTVSPGTTVTWTNNDSTVHNVISASGISVNTATTTSLFASNSLSQGQTFSFTFTKKGTYFYECSIHKVLPAMHAEIVVK